MSDLIDRQAAIEALWDEPSYTDPLNVLAEARDRIKGLPSAQPEIIHCRDCKHWIPGCITDQDDFVPPKCGKYQQFVGHSNDDFCSYADAEDGV